MTKYEKSVRDLMKDMVNDLGLDKKTVMQKREALEWFRKNYPEIDYKTVECHLTRMSINAPSRLHYNAVPREDDLLFKLSPTEFRLFDPQNDPAPIWSEKQAPSIGSRKFKQEKSYEKQVSHLVDNLEELHETFYQVNVFSGPSLYFHGKSLSTRDADDNERHLEYIYATLVSWGMHRMGPRGSKMVGFETFKNSVDDLRPEIQTAKNINYQNVTKTEWDVLEKIFRNLKIMATGTSIVGNSKVMAHMMPNIIAPVDRAYTLRYLKEHIKNGLEYEWPLMRRIIEEFFIPVAKDVQFISYSKRWLEERENYPSDTSPMKIIDNLTIAAIHLEKRK